MLVEKAGNVFNGVIDLCLLIRNFADGKAGILKLLLGKINNKVLYMLQG